MKRSTVGRKSSRELVPKSISAVAPHHEKAMSESTGVNAPVTGVEHWTKKGDVRLFLWEKFVDAPDNKPAVLFVHGSSMASQPTFDLKVAGRADSSVMDWFARRGFVCWSVDMEGYGRSDKNRDITCDIANGADDLAAATDYISRTRGVQSSSSTAFLRARCAQHCSRKGIRIASRAWRSTHSSGPAKEVPRWNSGARNFRSFLRQSAGLSTKRSSTPFSSAIIPSARTSASSMHSPTRSLRSIRRCRTERTLTCARSYRSSIPQPSRSRRS